MELCGGMDPLILNLRIRWRVQLYALAVLSPGKGLRYVLNTGIFGPQIYSDELETEETFPLSGTEPRILDSSDRSLVVLSSKLCPGSYDLPSGILGNQNVFHRDVA